MIWIIIPAYNEEKALPATLANVRSQPGQYQVIVVDGGSTDATSGYLRQHAAITLLTAPKGRASQMNAGAQYAMERGAKPDDWLLFLHADTLLPPEALLELHRLESDSTVYAGGFQHRFSGDDWRLRLISWLDNFRCRTSKVVYGDQAFFIRRAVFQQIGGFPDLPMLEDVAICQRLLPHITPVLLAPPVMTDSRKFVQMGIWRSLARVCAIILCVQFHLPIFPKAFFQDIR